MHIYKNKNPLSRKLRFITAARIALVVLPVFVLVFLLRRIGSENYIETAGFAVTILGMVIAYAGLSRHYRILLSGHNGERALFKIIRHIRHDGYYAVFTNLPVICKKNRSEIDMLLVGERGIIIIEVKNHSGIIIGNSSDDFWLQRKKFSGGKSAEKKMLNPLIQLRRQRGIIKSLLREQGLDVWVENLLYFSNPSAKLRLNLGRNSRVFSERAELINFINKMKSEKQLTKKECGRVIKFFRKMDKN